MKLLDLIIRLFADNLSGTTLVILTFLITAIISFSTGTSWGAYAMTIPVVLPLAYDLTGGEINPLIYQTIAAIAGGGIFGDNASPVSDTTVLSSVGAGCDHIDHVITQLPYAILIGIIGLVMLYFSINLYIKMTTGSAKKLFTASVVCLTLVQIVYVIDKIYIWN